ncbi:MAG: TIGR03619 family F420-dependent LLM class oxidoreductase [Dehalococcoidia bacterium]
MQQRTGNLAGGMRFGVVLPHFRAVASPSAIRDVSQAAERLGFDSIWVTDRAAIPNPEVRHRFGPEFYDPYATLAFVAGLTERVRLGATVLVLPFRQPVLTARALATLDQFSAGRLIVGIGAGWMPEEFSALGVPFEQRGRLTDEYLDAILALWASPVATFAGPTVKFESLVSEPRPLQQPRPPLYVGGATPPALRRTVKYGDAWHGSPMPLSQLRLAVEALETESRRQGRDPATIGLSTRAPLRITADRRALDADEVPEYPAGTPDQVLAAIRRYRAAGFTELVFDTFFAHPALEETTPEGILHTLELFARAIIPAFTID